MHPNASHAADESPDGRAGDGAQDERPPGSPGKSRSRAKKFLYATGDRPLDGYTIKRGVGHGGFGEVYFATSDAGKEVALKLIRRNLDIELRGVRQCLNLKHPNLIALYDIRTDSVEDEWVVMEFVSGESLEDLLDRCPDGLPVEEALAWFRGIAAGVGYLHQSGIVHRDLKPGNLFIEGHGGAADGGTIKIGDYGLSKFISNSRRSGQTESVGTVHYMAPEIAGGRYGREIDTYALGIVLYEMLTGHVPFEGESAGEVLMKHLTAEPDLSRVEDPYRSIIARALAKDPEARLKSVEEMVALLPSADPTAHAGQPTPPPVEPSEAVWSPVSAPPHKPQPSYNREPLWQALVELVDTGRVAWRRWPVPPLLKGLVLFGAVALLFFSGLGIAIPMAILPFYVVYYIVWSIFLQDVPPLPPTPTAVAPNGRPADGAAEGSPVSEKPNAKRARQFGWREAARKKLRERTKRERTRSVVGSMLAAAAVAIGASGVAAPLLAANSTFDPWTLGVWLAAVGTLGSWGVLVSNALTEGRVEDRAPIRLLQLLAGAVIGAAAFGLAATLGMDLLPEWRDATISRRDCVLNQFFGVDLYDGVEHGPGMLQTPLAASVAYFGMLFGAMRWWRHAEFIRRTRISLWSTALCVAGAWMLGLVFWYPQPLGMVVAGVIALATQFASPWLPPSKRAELARGVAA